MDNGIIVPGPVLAVALLVLVAAAALVMRLGRIGLRADRSRSCRSRASSLAGP